MYYSSFFIYFLIIYGLNILDTICYAFDPDVSDEKKIIVLRYFFVTVLPLNIILIYYEFLIIFVFRPAVYTFYICVMLLLLFLLGLFLFRLNKYLLNRLAHRLGFKRWKL